MRVRLTPRETIIEGTPGERSHLSASFGRSHFVRLPGLLEPGLARELHQSVEANGFFEREDPGIARELTSNDATALGLIALMLNDSPMRALVGELAGRIPTVWSGRIYRFIAGGFYDSWHSDTDYDRVAAISINLSPVPFEGCALEIRDANSSEIVSRVANTGLGDAVLFRIHETLEHRNTALLGVRPRTVCAGFFRVGETFAELLELRGRMRRS